MKGTADLFLVLLLVFPLCISHAANIASVSQGDIRFGIDTALFDYTGTDTLGLEVYQQFRMDDFSMDQDSMSRFTTTLVLMDENGDTVAVDQWNTETKCLRGRSGVNSVVLPVVPGHYIMSVSVTDSGNGRTSNISRDLTVEPLGSISQIELARAVVSSPPQSTNPLRKGELLVYPAANGSYTLPREHMAYYYLELYGLQGETVRMQGRLETSGGETVFARPWITVNIPSGANAVGLVDSLDLRPAVSSGLYRLVFDLQAMGDTLEAEKFLVIGRDFGDSLDQASAETAQLQSNPYYSQFRLILSSSEKDVYDGLDQQGASRFYTAYWQGSPDQRRQFEERCDQAEQKYSTPYREGWETDRGRVYIIYGPPDDIEASVFQGEHVSYEIWYYYTGGNDSFVFADISSTGDYKQVYSSVDGEVSYSNWESIISPVASGGTQ